MNDIIEFNLNMAKGLFDNWSQSQDTSSALYPSNVEKYLMRLLYEDLKHMQHYPSETLGEYVKAFMGYARHKIEDIKQQSLLSK